MLPLIRIRENAANDAAPSHFRDNPHSLPLKNLINPQLSPLRILLGFLRLPLLGQLPSLLRSHLRCYLLVHLDRVKRWGEYGSNERCRTHRAEDQQARGSYLK